MKYISLTAWRDLTDGHLYQHGEVFPHDGREVQAERINSLVSGRNQAGMALIMASEESVEEMPTQKETPVKRASKGRKRAE